MPLETKIEKAGKTFVQPKPGSLVVCAGTITEDSVNSMGAGFVTFHALFSKDRKWKTTLQTELDLFYKSKGSHVLPSFIKTNACAKE